METPPPGTPRSGDAFGEALLDYLDNGERSRGHHVERDDGFLDFGSAGYFVDQPSIWTEPESRVPELAGRRVLDIGAGAGKHALALQEAGHDVVALDLSPGAVEACRRRGVRQTFLGTVGELAAGDPEPFDTLLMCGNNVGLLRSPGEAPQVLGELAAVAVPGATIVGTCVDPFGTEDPFHLAYHERNRRLGRHPGQLRLRVRWADLATEWFDYLFVPPAELASLAAAGGWDLVEHGTGPGPYLAVLRLPT